MAKLRRRRGGGGFILVDVLAALVVASVALTAAIGGIAEASRVVAEHTSRIAAALEREAQIGANLGTIVEVE